jgi:hypothetical protein
MSSWRLKPTAGMLAVGHRNYRIAEIARRIGISESVLAEAVVTTR